MRDSKIVDEIVIHLRELFPDAQRLTLYVSSDQYEVQITQVERIGATSLGYNKTLSGNPIPVKD